MNKKLYKIISEIKIDDSFIEKIKAIIANRANNLFTLVGKISINTEIKYTKCALRDKRAWWLNYKIDHLIKEGKDFKKYLKELHENYTTKTFVTHNVSPTVGRAILAKVLTGDETDGKINYTAVGAGSIAATITQTQLADEIFRKLTASTAYGSGVDAHKAYITAFYTAGDFIGTVREVGLFIQGNASANTGYLFSRHGKTDSADLPLDKSAAETLSVEYCISILS
jgi:hypothetical protein